MNGGAIGTPRDRVDGRLKVMGAASRLGRSRRSVRSRCRRFRATPPDYNRGDVPRALAAADVRVRQTYTTAGNANSPIGLFATVAVWDGNGLVRAFVNRCP